MRTRQRTRESHPLPSPWSWLYTTVFWWSGHACMCGHLHASDFCAQPRSSCVCLSTRTKSPSGPSHWMCQYETLLLFWGPFLMQLRGGVGPGWEQQGVSFYSAAHAGSHRVEAILTSTAELCHSHQRRQLFIYSYLHLHCTSIQYNIITRGTKKAKSQEDFVISSPGSEGFILGAAVKKLWELRQRSLCRKISREARWDLHWWTVFPVFPSKPHSV